MIQHSWEQTSTQSGWSSEPPLQISVQEKQNSPGQTDPNMGYFLDPASIPADDSHFLVPAGVSQC